MFTVIPPWQDWICLDLLSWFQSASVQTWQFPVKEASCLTQRCRLQGASITLQNHPSYQRGPLKITRGRVVHCRLQAFIGQHEATSTKRLAFETKAASAAQPCHLLLRHDLKGNTYDII
eukprot:s857_g10.t1